MCRFRQSLVAVVVTASCALFVATSVAQDQERLWMQYRDPVTDVVCGLIHGAGAEFVVLPASGALVKVSGPDIVLEDYLVDQVGNVYYDNAPAGFIDFDVDADGDRALFWMTLTGKLVAIDAFDASPSVSDLSPNDIRNTGCDACTKWDNPAACDDGSDDDSNDNSSDDSNNDDNGDDTDNVSLPSLTSLCGAGSSVAATLSMTLLLVGKGRRVSGKRR